MLSESQKEFCKSQTARMSCLDKWPWQPEGQKELAITLHAASVSEEHARKVIDWFIENLTECPSPQELRKVAYEQRPATVNPSRGCSHGCGGTGFIVASRTLADGSVYSGVKPCACRAGITAPVESPKPTGGKRGATGLSRVERPMFGERD